MALPDFTMRQLLEAGVHFGHQKHRWNPKMAPFIYGVRNNIHIIDLAQTVPMFYRALEAVGDAVGGGGRILFVGTKRQAAEPVAQAARNSAQYYVNSRWLGGMLTNWKTISHSIGRLRQLDELLDSGEVQGLTKKERLTLTRERDKLESALGGIKEMGGLPDLLFVIDTNKEAIAIQEARRLGIPVAAVVDSNSDPDGIAYPIPGNDDAGRAITLYCDLISRAAIDGISRAQGDAGVDLGAMEEVTEPIPAESEAEAPVEPEPAVAVEAAPLPEEEPVQVPEETTAPAPEEVAAASAPEPAESAVELSDDLKEISGLGKVMEGRLNELGITSYRQIADLTADDIVRLDQQLGTKGRIDRDNWVEQARNLAEGRR